MKKFIRICMPFFTAALSVAMLLCLVSCKENKGLAENVVELRENIYAFSCEDYTLKAAYGYRTENGEKIRALKFRLSDLKNENAAYSVSFTANDSEFGAEFIFDPIKNFLLAEIEINDFTPPSFAVVLNFGAESDSVVLTSEVPENTLSYAEVLELIEEKQPSLIAAYSDESGIFVAEIIARITVKEDKPYWYIGLKNGDDLKALLADGFTGEVLAVRNVY